jgi:O-antigen/teichoic acid export membrane protein
LSSIKKLAGDTLWYGGSSIAARFLNYLLTPYLTLKLSSAGYGDMSLVYAAIPFLNVIFTYGLETAFFRFSHKEEYKKDIYSTASISIFISTLVLSLVLFGFNGAVTDFVRLNAHPEFIRYSIVIIALDTLATLFRLPSCGRMAGQKNLLLFKSHQYHYHHCAYLLSSSAFVPELGAAEP